MSRIAGREPGFTLVELLIVVVLAGLVGATVVNLFRYQTRIFRSENQSVQLDQNLRAGMDLMVRELRNAGMKDRLYAYGTLPGILSADSSSVRFTADFHSTDDPEGGSDGDALDGNEDVEYTFTPVDSTLRRRTRGTAGDSGAQPMAEYVTGVRFTYLDAAGDTLGFPISGAALGTIRRIGIALQGAAPDGQSATRLESDVVPRNLGL